MTYSNTASSEILAANTDELPRPDANSIEIASDTDTHTVLPRPISTRPNISDSGRVSFGAGFRLPLNK